MTEHDYNGHRIKPGHSGEPRGHPTGPYRDQYVWLVARHDDKLYGYWDSRHAAVGALATMDATTRTQRPDWFDPVRVPVESVREHDVIELNETPRL
jgi:hypothetical protein